MQAPLDQRPPGGPHRLPTDVGRFAALGLQYALTVALLGAAGWWLDERLATSPWLLVIGLALGMAGGFVMVVRAVPPARGRTSGGGRSGSGSAGGEPE